MRIFVGLVGLAAGLVACSKPAPPAAEPATPAAATPAAATPITIDLVFSKAAAAKLTELGEGVIVSAYYHGLPKPGVDLGEEPFLDLGSEDKEVAPAPQSVVLSGAWDQTLAKDLDGAPMINVNVYSARKSGELNLLHCDVVTSEIATAAAQANPVACKLIGE